MLIVLKASTTPQKNSIYSLTVLNFLDAKSSIMSSYHSCFPTTWLMLMKQHRNGPVLLQLIVHS